MTDEPDGADLADEVQCWLERFLALPNPEYITALVLWVVHTHLLSSFDSSPRLAMLSPEPASGKTRVLEVLGCLCPRPLHVVETSTPGLFRSLQNSEGPPTIFYDEVDGLFKGRSERADTTRSILNGGHRRKASVLRARVSDRGPVVTEGIELFAAVALAGLGELPNTLATRSVILRMKPRLREQVVAAFRRRQHEPQGRALGERLAVWATSRLDAARDCRPSTPDELSDRNADKWEPLLASAELLGGHWPERGRVAAVAFVAEGARRPRTRGRLLLSDIKSVFGTDEKLSSEALVGRLKQLPESPWGSLNGGGLSANQLSRLLAEYDIVPKGMRIGTASLRGYSIDMFADAFGRYVQ